MKTVTLEMIETIAKKGVSAKEASKQLGINYKAMHYILKKSNINYKKIQIGKSPQLKAWDTRKKQDAIESYKNTASAGLKAGISKKFKIEFGISLKDFVTAESAKIEAKIKKIKVKEVKVKKIKVATTKETFKQKELELMIPYSVKQLFEAQNKRIEALEQLLMAKK